MRAFFHSILVAAACVCSPLSSAQAALWEEIEASPTWAAKQGDSGEDMAKASTPRILRLDVDEMWQQLRVASAFTDAISSGMAARGAGVTVELPMPDGDNLTVEVIPSAILPPALQQKFPDILAFEVVGKDDNAPVHGSIEMSASGFHGMIAQGGQIALIDLVRESAVAEPPEDSLYASRWAEQEDESQNEPHVCSLDSHKQLKGADEATKSDIQSGFKIVDSSDITLYRIAISATGEYTSRHGGKVSTALAAIATSLNRINQVFERDAGIRFQLVDNNDEIIFTQAGSDPFDGLPTTLLTQNQQLLDRVIGDANYDLGHLFTTGGGGLAYVGSACKKSIKGMGITGNASAGGTIYDIKFAAHELAHQFEASHSFNSEQAYCGNANRSPTSAYEPGSGSTIMSYAGNCGSDDLQGYVDPLFHIGTIRQMQQHKKVMLAQGCGTLLANDNNLPEADAGDDYAIPAGTPFRLTGSADDRDGDALNYNWQQVDTGRASPVNVDTGNNSLFRTLLPSSSTLRTFPDMDVALGKRSIKGEVLPATNRVMHFEFVVQDARGATASDATQIRVHKSGSAFALQQTLAAYPRGKSSTLFWNVAGTDLPPVSCRQVDISLSVDGGKRFDHLLAGRVENTGQATVYIPQNVPQTDNARFMLGCSDNIFFAVSPVAFKLRDDITGLVAVATENTGGEVASASMSGEADGGSAGGGSFDPEWLLMLMAMGLVLKYNSRQAVRVRIREETIDSRSAP